MNSTHMKLHPLSTTQAKTGMYGRNTSQGDYLIQTGFSTIISPWTISGNLFHNKA